jgi:drug/metabolite transporter (DMT)-like permease
MSRTNSLVGIALATVAAVSFAANTTLARVAYDGGSNVMTYLTVRTILAGAVVLVLLTLSRGPLRLPPRKRLAAFGIGIVLALYSFGMMSSIKFIPVALAVLIFYTYPLLTTVYLWLTGGERPNWISGTSLIIAFVGLILALDIGGASFELRGVAFATLAALGITTVVILNSRLVGGGDSRPVTLHMMASAAIVYTAVTLALGEWSLPVGAPGWWSFVGGPVFYAAAIISFFIAMSKLGPFRATLTMNLEPVSSMVLGFVLLGQVLTGWQLLGAGLVIAAVFNVQVARGRETAPAKGRAS